MSDPRAEPGSGAPGPDPNDAGDPDLGSDDLAVIADEHDDRA